MVYYIYDIYCAKNFLCKCISENKTKIIQENRIGWVLADISGIVFRGNTEVSHQLYIPYEDKTVYSTLLYAWSLMIGS